MYLRDLRQYEITRSPSFSLSVELSYDSHESRVDEVTLPLDDKLP
ncbi:hypothetical protein VNN41_03325 [Lactococcus garvieae]